MVLTPRAQTSAASIFNTVTCYTSTNTARRTYHGPASAAQLTDLSARLFGTWTLLATVVRTYAAYGISNPDLYTIAFWTYVIALAHYSSEWLVYRTVSMRKGLAVPFAVASTSTFWMWAQWSYYAAAE